MKKSSNFIQPLLFALFLSGGILLGMILKPGDGIRINGGGSRIEEILGLVNEFYVDTVNHAKMEEDAITELLRQLDPHSVFIAASEIPDVNAQLDGEFEGIGVEFNVLDDTIYVVNVIPGGPSEEAGLQAGDRIIRVNDTLVAGIKISNDQVIRKLKGPRKTRVKVSVMRSGFTKLLDYEITRGTIPLHSVDAKYLIDERTGYVKLSRFSATTGDEVRQALHELGSLGMLDLILDLRGNPGGYLTAAIQVADEFLDANKLIVYTEGRTQPRKSYKAEKKGLFEKGKLVVLIDEHSASASEIVSGAIQDWDRGLIIGRRSYGKGLVQEPFELRDGSMIRLTVSRYYTPTGRSIQKPYGNGYESYQMEVLDRWQHGEMENQDSVRSNDSLRYTTPAGRYVYGGGGIYPDVFVSVDTFFNRELLTRIYQKSVQRRYVYQYYDRNKPALKRFSSPTSFLTGFNWSAADVADIRKNLVSEGIPYTETQWQQTQQFLLNEMKALLARQLFDINAYFMVSNSRDKEILEALKALRTYESKLVAVNGR